MMNRILSRAHKISSIIYFFVHSLNFLKLQIFNFDLFTTLTCLCEETLVYPLQLDYFDSTFPCIPTQFSFGKLSQLLFLIFWGRTTEQNISALCFPTIPSPKHFDPPSSPHHRWELPGNYTVFAVVMIIYHYVERIRRILVTPIFL